MKNNFTPETRELFDLGNYCMDWEDGQNDADCLYHICGRVSSSPYNAAPLSNFRTHWPEWRTSHNYPHVHSFEVRKRLLNKTRKFLKKAGYQPNDDDLAFLEKFKKYYDTNIN